MIRAALGLLVLLPVGAGALPRFAARAGAECIHCHVNPSGGGARNDHGAEIFARLELPASAEHEVRSWVTGETVEQGKPAFSGALTEWLRIGADLRAGWWRLDFDRGLTPGAPPELVDTFFLMQADLYHVARLGHVTLALDVGVYAGFEAWGLVRPFDTEGKDVDLLVKFGRFMPPFGVRDAQHQLYTRERIGFGPADRDTGVEVTAYLGPATIQAALVNGTLGDTVMDTAGRDRSTFEKAISARAGVRAAPGPLRLDLGASLWVGRNGRQASPLFAPALAGGQEALAAGVDGIRTGPHLLLGAGHLAYVGELVYVRDEPRGGELGALAGYAARNELAVLVARGVDVAAELEFLDADVDRIGTSARRVSLFVEWFPWPYFELRPMVSRSWDDTSPAGGSFDVMLLAHVFP